MNFAESKYAGTIEILASNDYQAIPVNGAGSSLMKAGTPITSAGESSTGSGAIGILLYDVDPTKNPNGSAVVQGIIDSTKAQEHSAVTYVSALYEALPGIIFRTNIGVNGATGAT